MFYLNVIDCTDIVLDMSVLHTSNRFFGFKLRNNHKKYNEQSYLYVIKF